MGTVPFLSQLFINHWDYEKFTKTKSYGRCNYIKSPHRSMLPDSQAVTVVP